MRTAAQTPYTPNHVKIVSIHVTPTSTSTIAELLPGPTDSATHVKGVKLSEKDAPYLHVDGVIGSGIRLLGHNLSP
jgi:hypothetical protein